MSTGTRTMLLQTTDTGLVLPLRANRWSGTSPNTGRTYDDEPYLAEHSRDDLERAATAFADARAELDAEVPAG